MDVAALGLRVDATGVDRATKSLESLTAQGARAEKSLVNVEGAASKTGASLKTMGDGSEKGLGAVARSADTAASSVQGFGNSAKTAQQSLREMQAQLTAANQTVAQMAAAMASAVSAVQAAAKAQADATKSSQDLARAFQSAGEQVRAFSASAQLAATAGKESAAGVKALADAGNSLSTNMGLAVRGVQAFMALQVVSWAKESAAALYAASSSAERLRISLDFSSAVGSAAEIAYLRKTTFDLGLAFESTAKAYQSFSAATRGTALEGQKTREVFESVAKASAVMGLSADQTSGVLLALQQMVSKGTVASEELKSQLAERLPGAFQTAARAMGVTTAELGKMLEQGQVVADDFLPKFAQELNRSLGDAAEKAADRLDGAVNRFNTAWEKLKQTAGDSGVSQAMAREMTAISRDMTAISDAIENASKRGGGALESLGTGAAVAAGRAGFASLNLVANAFNGTINLLTGGILDLRTDLALLPDVLRPNSEQLAILQGKAKDAEENLAHLQSLGGQFGKEVWYQNEVERARAVAAEYRAALAQKQALMGEGGLTSAYTEGMGNNKTITKQREEEAASEKALAEIRQRAAGINKQYFADMKSLQDALDRGVISQEAYVVSMSELAKRTWDASTAGKEAAKSHKATAAAAATEQSEYARLIASIKGKTEQNKEELKYGRQLNDAEKVRVMLASQIEAGSKKLTAARAAAAKAALDEYDQTEKQVKAMEKLKKAWEEDAKAFDKLADQREAGIKTVQDHVKKLQLEEEAQALATASNISLAAAMERVTIARLEEQLQMARMGAESQSTINALERELQARKDLLGAISSKDVRDANKKATEEAGKDWEKVSQTISRTLSDYIMAGGTDAAVYLKRLFANLVLEPIVQMGVNSLLGMAAPAAGVAGGGLNPLSMLSGGKTAMGIFGGGAGAGFMNGLGAWGSGGSVTGVLSNPGLYTGAELLGTVAPILLGGFALMKILSGDWFGSRGPNHSGGVASTATQDRAEAARQALGVDAWGNTLGDFTSRGNAEIDKQLDTTLKGMLDLYKQLAKIGGATVKDIDIAAGFSVNPKHGDEGAMGFFQIIDKATGEILARFKDREMDTDPQKAWAKFVAEMGGALVTEIKKGDIPGWMKEELDALGDDVTVEGLNAAIQKIAVIDAAFKGWADTVTGFANLTAKAQTELLKFSNGIEALANNVNAFYAGFYSEQERAEILQRQVRDQLKKLGIDIDPAGGEAAKKAFRKLIEDALASGNNELAAKLLALAQLFGVAADAAQKSAEVAADAAKTAAEEAARALEEAQQKAKDLAMANFEAAIAREQQYWQAVSSNAQEAVQAITGILTPLKQAAKELFGSIESASQMQAVQGMLYIERAIAGLRGGAKLSSYDGLTDAITAARGGITSGRYASQFERDRDALVLANQLKQIAGYGDTQLSVEERQLKNSQEQLQKLDKTLGYWRDLLDGNKAQIDATLSVEQAIKALEALLFPDKPPTSGGGSGSGKTPTPDWGGGGGGGFQPANTGKYKTPTAILGGGAVIYDYATPDYEKRLDSLAPTFEKYRGTGDFTGLADDFRAAGGTAKDLAYLYGFSEADVLAALDRNGIPRFDVGTNRVPQDMLAMVHKDEAIVPAAFNPWAGGSMGGDLGMEFRAMRAELTQLREDQRAQASATLSLQRQTAKIIQRWDGDGLPHERQEQNA
ncbi:tape measure protein [Delftia tsuruhatensis]|uniref:tape measure protein n=1 Tax=Delftia tsuruhatensis TaxID=180282 RepID=UPI00202794C7|nr:tape measure protein [Delftia tsuruhatensis]